MKLLISKVKLDGVDGVDGVDGSSLVQFTKSKRLKKVVHISFRIDFIFYDLKGLIVFSKVLLFLTRIYYFFKTLYSS
jgi:hypothetical protein